MMVLNCAHVNVPDSEWCGDKGNLGAHCSHLLTVQTRDIPKDQWDVERFGMACTKLENMTALKGVVEKLCSQTKDCTYQQKQLIEKFFLDIQNFNESFSENYPSGLK